MLNNLEQEAIDEFLYVLSQAEGLLLACEKAMNKESYTFLFRALHNIKGSCGMFESFQSLTSIIHQAETEFRAQEGLDRVPAQSVDTILKLFDQFRAEVATL